MKSDNPPKPIWRGVAFFAILFVIALWLDRGVAAFVHDSGVGAAVKGTWWAQVIKEPGEIRLAVVIAVGLVIARVISWRLSLFIVLAQVMGLLNAVLKWIVGRHRPFTFKGDAIPDLVPWNVIPFRTGMGLVSFSRNLAFPSGHAATAFATATALALLFPRWRAVFYAIATLTAIERFAENAHWVSDAVAGAGISWIGVQLLWRWAQGRCARRPICGDVSQQTSISGPNPR